MAEELFFNYEVLGINSPRTRFSQLDKTNAKIFHVVYCSHVPGFCLINIVLT